MTFKLDAKKEVALDSPDHLCPVGCVNDNFSSIGLISEVIQYFGGKKISVLDLGCSGGKFVVDFIERGHDAIGLEGSSNCLTGSGKYNWDKYHNTNLFLCDITEEYQLYENDEPLKFDYIHSEEVFEHISVDKIDNMLKQIKKHLKEDGICSFGISKIPHEVVIDDQLYILHQSVFPPIWWKNKLIQNGFEILDNGRNDENYFGYIFNNVIRTDCQESSCYFCCRIQKTQQKYNSSDLTELLHNYINQPENAEHNFDLAVYYHDIGQTATAVSYYLRAAERTDDDLLKYECLIRGAMCFDSQGTRNFTVKGFLLHALAICPKRPEAYYLMSKFYEKENKDGSWNESFTISSIGLKVADLNPSPLRTVVNYPGEYALLFQKAISSWWCGLCEESRDLLLDLLKNYQMADTFQQKAIDNLKKMNVEIDLNQLFKNKLPMNINNKKISTEDFDWGVLSDEEKNIIGKEIFQDHIYDRFFSVKENDIVMDIGANVGAFSYSVLNKNPKHIYCIEPSVNLIDTIKNNLSGFPVTIIDSSVSSETCDFKEPTENDYIHFHQGFYKSKTFKDILRENNINHIDFLKIDCEGGEYDVFTEENKNFLLNNVKYIAGEWHFTSNGNSMEKFRNFINLYLKDHNNYKVFELSGREITDIIFNEDFLVPFEQWYNEYGHAQFMIYIENNIEDKKKSIPVIGTAVVNNCYWIKRLLESVDYPVDNFVIINNNGRGQLDEELNNLTKITHKYIKNIKVCHMPANIGCGGAWNLIIKSYMMAPYWIIVSDDVAFCPGFLEEMVSVAESDSEIGIIHGHAGDFGVGSWDVFLMRDHVVQKFGLFDENLYPAYCEDSDYIMRFQHHSIKKVMSLNSNYYHGHGDKTEYYKEGCQTQKSEPELKEKLDHSNNLNIEYLTEKWGPGWRMCSPEDLPFKGKEHSISETTYDLSFVRRKHLGF